MATHNPTYLSGIGATKQEAIRNLNDQLPYPENHAAYASFSRTVVPGPERGTHLAYATYTLNPDSAAEEAPKQVAKGTGSAPSQLESLLNDRTI